jgi:hypothetical protein
MMQGVLESCGKGRLKRLRLFCHRRRIVIVGRERTPVLAREVGLFHRQAEGLDKKTAKTEADPYEMTTKKQTTARRGLPPGSSSGPER